MVTSTTDNVTIVEPNAQFTFPFRTILTKFGSFTEFHMCFVEDEVFNGDHESFVNLLADARPFENLFTNLQALGPSRHGPNLTAHRPNSKSGPEGKAAHACEKRRRGFRAKGQPKWSRKRRLRQTASGQCPRGRTSADDKQRRSRRKPATRREPAATEPSCQPSSPHQ